MSAFSEILNINNQISIDSSIQGYEVHSFVPYTNSNFNSSDEIRISIQPSELFSLPCESYLYVEFSITCNKDEIVRKTDTTPETTKVVPAAYTVNSNPIANLFSEIRFDLSGHEIQRLRYPNIASQIKAYLCQRAGVDTNSFELAGIKSSGWSNADHKYQFLMPLKMVMGFFEDFQQILLHVKQELILVRTSHDKNLITSAQAKYLSVNISKICWRMPFVKLADSLQLRMLKLLDDDHPLPIGFRHSEVFEYPLLPLSKSHSWVVKTASFQDRPSFVVVGFQTDRKNQYTKTMAEFDDVSIINMKLFLNNIYFPYENTQSKFEIFYQMFLNFSKSYYNLKVSDEYGLALTFNDFKTKAPLYVIDCSHQLELLKSNAVDIRLEWECSVDVKANTTAYAMLISDKLLTYKPLTGIVTQI